MLRLVTLWLLAASRAFASQDCSCRGSIRLQNEFHEVGADSGGVMGIHLGYMGGYSGIMEKKMETTGII